MGDFTDLCGPGRKTSDWSWLWDRLRFSLVLRCWAAEFGLRGGVGRADLANEAKVAEIVRKGSMY